MTDAEMIKAVIQDRRAHSLETILITRDRSGSYVISSFRGISICDDRDAMLTVLNGVLDIQDTNFEQ